jgi:enoyl-CoA hydratase/carnithine racemase
MTAAGVRVSAPKPGITMIELDRPDRGNAINRSMSTGLAAAFRSVDSPVIVIGSTRAGTFCTGADVSVDNDERRAVSDELYAVYEVMIESPATIIAAVAGPAVGGGAQLAIAADVRIVSANAYFRFLGPGHGLAVGAWALPTLVGHGRAFEICSTMRVVAADEAVRIGLATSVAGEPTVAALALADQLLAADRGAIARLKSLIGTADRLAALRAERTGNREAWDGRPPAR